MTGWVQVLNNCYIVGVLYNMLCATNVSVSSSLKFQAYSICFQLFNPGIYSWRVIIVFSNIHSFAFSEAFSLHRIIIKKNDVILHIPRY